MLLCTLADDDSEVCEMLFDPCRSAPAAGVKPLQHKRTTDGGLLDVEAIDIELVVVFGVGDRRLQYLLDVASDATMGKSELCQREGGGLAADRLGDKVEFARAGAQPAQTSLCLGLIKAAWRRWLAHFSPSAPVCRQHGRKRFGLARTRRACDRSCSRLPTQG